MKEEPTYSRITVEELYRVAGEEKELILIDTLTRDHFEKVHLPGAQQACVYEVTFLDQIAAKTPGKDSPIVVYGAGAGTADAAVAAEKLVRAGYLDVRALRGGIEYWRKAGYPLEGSAAEAPEPPETGVLLPEGTFLAWIRIKVSSNGPGETRTPGITVRSPSPRERFGWRRGRSAASSPST